MVEAKGIVSFVLDGITVTARVGESVLDAADRAGVFVPRLCAHRNLSAHGSCRLCTVKVGDEYKPACTLEPEEGMEIAGNTDELNEHRKVLIELLFVEGNHYCSYCEKEGACELQALARRYGATAPRFPFLFPERLAEVCVAGVFIDRNRCTLCGRCVRKVEDSFGEGVLYFEGKGEQKNLVVGKKATAESLGDAAEICPVGAIFTSRSNYTTPIGKRRFDDAGLEDEVLGKGRSE